MSFDPAFLDEIRNRVSLTQLIGRRHKLVRSGRNWKACCPFHQEKTPSFYIYDDHFHCFGCGQHGDAISFLMHSEGRSFPEAVEQLASEAGLDMPRPDPHQQEQGHKIASLHDILEHVQAFYRQQLYKSSGQQGLDYFLKRGLSASTIDRFGLGWSGNGRGLVDALRTHEITPEMLAKSGVLRCDDSGRPTGELFFNRVTFPIRDRRGRILSFGARTLGDAQPKYLNGPETLLFSKRKSLYNIERAYEAARKGEDVIVVEGYMDVIALDQAGFHGAVAPLGTALSEDQLLLLWRVTKVPIFCLDGDLAGARAALRVCEVALPLLNSERRLRFCRLDPKDDPDSLINRAGAQGMQAVLNSARPFVEELFNLVVGSASAFGPDERAALRERLVSLAQLIPDRSLASEYRRSLLDMFFARFRPRNKQSTKPHVALNGTGAELVSSGTSERLYILTAILLTHPYILPEVEQAFAHLELPLPLDKIRAALLDWMCQDQELNTRNCRRWLEDYGLWDEADRILESRLPRAAGTDFEGDEILRVELVESWWHFYGLVNFDALEKSVNDEIEQAIHVAYSNQSDGCEIFPPGLLAKRRALENLRQGEPFEEAE